jgi:hypothetical protein
MEGGLWSRARFSAQVWQLRHSFQVAHHASQMVGHGRVHHLGELIL